MCGLPSTVRSYYCNHIANTNQILQLNTQRHTYYTCTPHMYSHRHLGELAPNPTSITTPPPPPPPPPPQQQQQQLAGDNNRWRQQATRRVMTMGRAWTRYAPLFFHFFILIPAQHSTTSTTTHTTTTTTATAMVVAWAPKQQWQWQPPSQWQWWHHCL